MTSNQIEYRLVQNENHLLGILRLQQANLKSHLTDSEKDKEGFVSLEHDLDMLSEMNVPYPHVIALHKGEVVGYTLVMLKTMAKKIPVLFPMFDMISKVKYEGEVLAESKYFVMGQVCIDKAYRGQNIFYGLYKYMSEVMSNYFDFIITEIDFTNRRSMRAHEKAGFEIVHTYWDSDGIQWAMVLLDIRRFQVSSNE